MPNRSLKVDRPAAYSRCAVLDKVPETCPICSNVSPHPEVGHDHLPLLQGQLFQLGHGEGRVGRLGMA